LSIAAARGTSGSMKLLSDFDGVWTHPEREARAQGELLDERLAALVPEARRDEARAWVASARLAIRSEPTRWGWASDGRVAAFADEDPFGEHSAVLHVLAAAAPTEPIAALLHAGALAAGGSLDAFGLDSHLEGVARVEAERGPGVLAAAVTAGRAMLERDVEIVVVSNSAGEKLVRWFEHAALPYRPHPQHAPRALRLRGNAGKHLLDPARSERLALDGASVELARPYYEAILREEAPDAIVGDVFSLDLALPLSLRRSEPSWRHVRLFWLVRDYTPERMRRAVAAAAPEIEPVASGLEGVAAALLA
jgi:hypothetical protein